MRLSTKSGFMAAALLVVMLLMAGTGYWSGKKLSDILAYITGPAWDTADGAMETEIGIQGEMAWMQSRLLGVSVTDEQLHKSTSMTDEAFARLIAAKIMDKRTSDKVFAELTQFRINYAQLRKRFETVQALQQKIQSNAELMLRLGEAMEELGGRQSQLADGVQNSSANGVKKYWNSANGNKEILSGFYLQLYYLEQLVHSGSVSVLPQLILSAVSAQQKSVDAMVESGVFNEPIKAFGAESAAKLYAHYFSMHKELMLQSVEEAQQFRHQFTICGSSMTELLSSLGELEEMGDSAVEAQTASVTDTINVARFATVFMLVLVSATVASSYFLLNLWVLTPINELFARINDLVRGEGDLTVRIGHLNNDELGDLGRGINQLMDLLHGLVVKINSKGHEIVEKIDFNRSLALSTFNHTKNVSDNAQNLAAASGQVFVAAGAIAGACVRAASSVVEARTSTASCMQTTRDTAAGMAKVFDQVSELSTRITQLRNSAETIGNIVSVIGGISDQTNLLALNAAIEAARAGEQGRGFAVVADEVRTLASRTSQSTHEIAGVIHSIQGMSQSAFELINTCTQEVSSKAQDSQSVCDALNLLTRVVDDLSGMVEQAASAAEEQTAVTKDMSMRVKVIAEDSAHVDTQARASMESADGLNRLARELNLELSRFRV